MAGDAPGCAMAVISEGFVLLEMEQAPDASTRAAAARVADGRESALLGKAGKTFMQFTRGNFAVADAPPTKRSEA
eukprot:8792564-Pyramimonas_sp.AAC.1